MATPDYRASSQRATQDCCQHTPTCQAIHGETAHGRGCRGCATDGVHAGVGRRPFGTCSWTFLSFSKTTLTYLRYRGMRQHTPPKEPAARETTLSAFSLSSSEPVPTVSPTSIGRPYLSWTPPAHTGANALAFDSVEVLAVMLPPSATV